MISTSRATTGSSTRGATPPPEEPTGKKSSPAVMTWISRYGVYVALVILLLLNMAITDHFMTASNLRLQLIQTAPTLIVAMGMAMVIGTQGIDLSVGAVMALSAAVVPLYIGYGSAPAILIGLLFGIACGLFAGFLVAVVGLQPIVATLSVMIGGRGLANVIAGSIKTIDDPGIVALGTESVLGIPYSVLIGLIVVLIVAFLVRRTTFGLNLESIGANKLATKLAGVRIGAVLLAVYAINGLLAALSGIIVAARTQASDPKTVGLLMEMDAIAAVVIGGTSLNGGKVRVLGTVAGALLMQLIAATLVSHNAPDSMAQMVEAVVIVAAVFTQVGRRKS
ncbi:ABC transporter permease [Acidipropionibacterium virtanenii]|uniref:Inner membrane ABC transporter permease protein YtfT n=1 Tax=Acidipropionibacterium virtanenii TaxID=2057246 RepID=A0A344UXZ5_9ACTN|nr:ABC transporter permease [Acidipropionibacterium virtanenii]AXE40143.1 Inner membrane ABC transporter permease protein YtfT [Acidipropionibacterium virtanenii]